VPALTPASQSDATPPPALDPAQFKLFQQLASVAAGAPPAQHIQTPFHPPQAPAQAYPPTQAQPHDPRQRPRDPRLAHVDAQPSATNGADDPRQPNGNDHALADPRRGRIEERRAAPVRPRDARSLSPVPRAVPDTGAGTSAGTGAVRRPARSPPRAPRSHRAAVPPVQPAPVAPVASVAPAPTPSAAPDAPAAQQDAATLDKFDWAGFDATAAGSWAALARAWTVSNGAAPAQEELMFLLSAGLGIPPPVAGPWGPGWFDMYGYGEGGAGAQGQAPKQAFGQRRAALTDAVPLGPDDAGAGNAEG
jgi:hypothetical protein